MFRICSDTQNSLHDAFPELKETNTDKIDTREVKTTRVCLGATRRPCSQVSKHFEGIQSSPHCLLSVILDCRPPCFGLQFGGTVGLPALWSLRDHRDSLAYGRYVVGAVPCFRQGDLCYESRFAFGTSRLGLAYSLQRAQRLQVCKQKVFWALNIKGFKKDLLWAVWSRRVSNPHS